MRQTIVALIVCAGMFALSLPTAMSEDPAWALAQAAAFGIPDRVKKALQAGADVNSRGAGQTTPIMIASERGFSEIVGILSAAGADVNLRSEDGLTALMMAARSGRIDVVELLLEKGADIGAKDKLGFTAEKWATVTNQREVIALLQNRSGQ